MDNLLEIYSDQWLEYQAYLTKPRQGYPPADIAEVAALAQQNYLDLIGELGNIPAAVNEMVPQTRVLTINGVSQDLSADRTWTVSVTETDPEFATWLAGPPNLSEFNDDIGIVPDSRTLTIDGITYDLTANRTWTTSGGGGDVNIDGGGWDDVYLPSQNFDGGGFSMA